MSYSARTVPMVVPTYLGRLGIREQFFDEGLGTLENVQSEEPLQVHGGAGASMGGPEEEHAVRAVCYIRVAGVGSCKEVCLKGAKRVRLGCTGQHEGAGRTYLLDNETAHAVRHE